MSDHLTPVARATAAAVTPVLEAEGLRQRYGQRQVLAVDHLAVHSGSITAVIGPSGAGKSTLLRILALLQRPSEGRLRMSGSPVPAAGKERLAMQRRMTLVGQQTLLFDTTVAANVGYGLRMRGLTPTVDQLEQALAQVSMQGFLHQRARSLSGGEAQRVAMARAAILEPDVLLLDEPTANLDPANVATCEQVVTELARRGTAVVIVTHNLFQARRLAHSVLYIHGGELLESGTATQVFERPSDPRTKAFLEGRMVY